MSATFATTLIAKPTSIKTFFAACRNIIPTSYAAFSLSNNLAGIMSVLTVRCKDYADIVGTHMDQLLNQQFESEQIESHAADNLNKEQEIAQIVPRCQRALYRTVSESASYLTVVAALSHSVKSTSTSTAADSCAYQDLENNSGHIKLFLRSSVDHLMAMLNDVMKVSLLTPHVVTVISFRSIPY